MNVLCLGSFVSVFCNRADGVATSKFLQLPIKTLKKKTKPVCLVLLSRYTNMDWFRVCRRHGETGGPCRQTQTERQTGELLPETCLCIQGNGISHISRTPLSYFCPCMPVSMLQPWLFSPEEYLWCALFF